MSISEMMWDHLGPDQVMMGFVHSLITRLFLLSSSEIPYTVLKVFALFLQHLAQPSLIIRSNRLIQTHPSLPHDSPKTQRSHNPSL